MKKILTTAALLAIALPLTAQNWNQEINEFRSRRNGSSSMR